MANVAIIPARGGSKRIPRKNLRDFCGRPMIAWSIKAALRSECFDRVIVSTDDDEIAEVARLWGAEVPFSRPPELSDDYTPTRPVVNHAIREIEKRYGLPEYVCCIYATAPLVQVEDIQSGLALMKDTEVNFVFTATSFPYPIQRALKLTSEGRVEMFYPEFRFTRSQDLEQAYHDAGQFYWGRTAAFLADLPTFSESSIPVILPRFRVHDIDTEEDWKVAETLFSALRSNPVQECPPG